MNELHEKINQAKKELNLSNNGLAAKLGYSKPYITKVLNKLPGDKVQKRLIGEVDVLLNPISAMGKYMNGEGPNKSKGFSVGGLVCRASGDLSNWKLEGSNREIAKQNAGKFWLEQSIRGKNEKIVKLETEISNERILSVIIFAVILALFLASHAI